MEYSRVHISIPIEDPSTGIVNIKTKRFCFGPAEDWELWEFLDHAQQIISRTGIRMCAIRWTMNGRPEDLKLAIGLPIDFWAFISDIRAGKAVGGEIIGSESHPM